MHIPDGLFQDHVLAVNAATMAASVAVGGLALWRARKTLGEKQAPLLGVTAAFVFAAQMLNFPIAGGTSGHFLGAFLAALLLGPLCGFLVMAIVLTIQCFMFGDGGLTVLGANIFNQGLVGGVVAYGLFQLLRRAMPRMAAVAVGAWLSVVLAAAACAVELGVTRTMPLSTALLAMSGWHALIAVGEAFITTAAVGLVLSVRPDILHAWSGSPKIAQVQS